MGAPAVQVRMLTCMAGVGFVWSPGDVVSVSPGEAQRFVAAGFAEMIREAPKEVATTKARVERARK